MDPLLIKSITRYSAVGVVALIGLILCTSSISCVPAGHVGVVTTFGKVEDDPLDSGINLVAFWRKVHYMSIQTQEEKETASTPTKEGLSVHLESSLLFSLRKDAAVRMYRDVGKDYAKVVLEPSFRSALRGATVKHASQDLYTASRSDIESELEKTLRLILDGYGINCERVLLRDMQLPPSVKEAIERKQAADQDAQQMEFVLKKAKQEAERKAIEAKGIADAQVIIKKDLDDNYIRYLWVMALKEHSGAVIYVPTGSDGLPFFREVHPSRDASKTPPEKKKQP
ncbi:MAG: prohibitin family protein [Planctomycetes bacterium]|nr:prohibitin family protein [Planctomycetota bacterium]